MSRFLRQHALLYLVGRCACYPRPNPALTDFSIALPVVASGRTLAPAAAVVPAPVAAAPAPLTALRLLACAGHFLGIGVAEESAARPPPRPRTPLRRAPCWPLHHTHSPTLSLHLHSPLHLSPPPQLPLPSLTHLPSSLPYPQNPRLRFVCSLVCLGSIFEFVCHIRRIVCLRPMAHPLFSRVLTAVCVFWSCGLARRLADYQIVSQNPSSTGHDFRV